MKAASREMRFTVPAILALFLGVGILAVFLLTGESSKARILVEYEADRIASSLADTYRTQGSLEPGALDPRVKGFALYSFDGNAIVRLGDAPDALGLEQVQPGFRFDGPRRRLVLERPLGMGGPGMMGPARRPGFPGGPGGSDMRGMMGGMMGNGPSPFPRRGAQPGPAGALFLSMDISSFRRSQVIYRTAAVASPFVVAGLAALFLSLLASNARHRRRAQEQDTLARLGESARTLAHEIRNPLSAIRIQTGLLRKKAGADASTQLDAIDEEVERLSLLSHRVSDFLKNPRGNPQRIELDPFLRDMAARQPSPVTYSSAADARGVSVSFDSDMLRSVIENLLRNAVESYADSQGPAELALTNDRGSVVISVRDRGKGISPENAERVFDPFFTDKVNGSGVGLSLSRRFTEAAGGTLRLMPRDGGGTEARLTLPAVPRGERTW